MWRALASALVLAVLIATPVRAEDRPQGYFEAQRAFDALSVEDRIHLQILLTAAGFWPAVPSVQFNRRIFTAVSQFQMASGFPPTGALSASQNARLVELAAPVLTKWGIGTITLPGRGTQLWAPLGLGLTSRPTRYGLSYTDAVGHFRLDFEHYDFITVDSAYKTWLAAVDRAGGVITYKNVRRDYYAVGAQNGFTSFYIRGHSDSSGITGFLLSYDNTDQTLFGERLEALISASLWSAMSPRAPSLSLPNVESVQRQASLPSLPTPPVAAQPSPPPDPVSAPVVSSGTAFFVSAEGDLLTNAHVLEGCRTIKVNSPGGLVPVRLAARDAANDLALLKSDLKPPRVARFRNGVRLGESVAAFGYPLAGVLSTSGNFTLGNITALTGLSDDTRFFQISAPVQPGNSGGPLIDASGNFVGVVSAKLNALNVMLATNGDIPQNVNFAIKGSVAATFLESNGVAYQTGTLGAAIAPADLADMARDLSVYVKCE